MDITLDRKNARKFMVLCLVKGIKAEYLKIDHMRSIKMDDLYVVIRVQPLPELQLFELGAYWHSVLMGKALLPKIEVIEPFDSIVKHEIKTYEIYRANSGRLIGKN